MCIGSAFQQTEVDSQKLYHAFTPLSPQRQKDAPGFPGAPYLMHAQQQVELPQPQPFPLLLQPLLPQPHQMMISRMMIQQQLPPPKPLLHIQETSYAM